MGIGTGLYLLLFDHEPAAEVYALASPTGSKARVGASRRDRSMIEGAPELAARCEVLKDCHLRAATRSTFKVLSRRCDGAPRLAPACA